ncbi:hypothetical protein LZG04_07060 [Saccharothrix sp. S26]|uniref:hypothetical protein n=1 Tax=Saccharothrix sp. S26 TaxID=2907215 RepID=UPI001F176887|nr:hypothetical protein [Saccharothrix sp. S26]MCE6994568.1 hypothetical protein [Saccharothrix sp. S26]
MEIAQVLDNALRKAAAVWIRPDGHEPRLVWALWRDGTLLVAVGGTEQEVPGLVDGVACTVTVRSPTTHSHLVDARATARRTDLDDDARAALTAARLNGRPEWADVYRLELA